MSRHKKRDSVWWGSRILVIYGVAFTIIMLMMIMFQYYSNPILPEEEPLIGNTYAELQIINPGLAKYIWWIQMAFSLPGFTYPALFTLALAWWGVRSLQRWAWYTILILNIPFWILFYIGCRAIHTTYILHWLVFTPFLVLLLIGLILSGRQIFTSKA